MDAGLGAGSDVRVADRGERRHRRHMGVAEPRAFAPQSRERREHVGVGIEVVRPRAVENEQRHHARPSPSFRERLPQRPAECRRRRNRAEQRRERRHDVLLRHGAFDTPCLMNGAPWNSSGTCVSYVHGEPCMNA